MEKGEGKESTLLSQSESLLKTTHELEAILSDRFKRNPVPEDSKAEFATSQDNVLDEIADNLRQVATNLHTAIDFLSSAVLPKIN